MKEVKKQKELKKKLSLNKETITNLNELGMNQIRGGEYKWQETDLCSFTCAVPKAAC